MALTKIKTSGIADNAITNAKMADDAIDSVDLAAGSIDNAHLAGSIAVSKTLLAGGTGLTLSTNTLAVDAAQTQITSVGTLTSFRSTGIDDNADALAITIDSSENVGIGGSPTSITNHKVLEITNTGSNGRATLALTANTGEYSNLYMGDSGDIDIGGIQYYHGTNQMDFYTNAGSRMTILSSGKVGIGVTAPAQILEIHNPTTSSYTDFGLKGTGHKYVIGVGNDAVATVNDKLYFYDNDNSAFRMVLDTAGNVGIGHTAPIEPLHVKGQVVIDEASTLATANVPTSLYINAQADPTIGFGIRGSGGGANTILGIDDSDSDKFKITHHGTDIGGADHFVMDGSGKVGIGTASPSGYLDVRAPVGVSTPTVMYWQSNQHGLGFQSVVGSTYTTLDQLGSTYHLSLQSNGGKVGIGALAPVDMLTVGNTTTGGYLSIFGNNTDAGNPTAGSCRLGRSSFSTTGAAVLIASGYGGSLVLVKAIHASGTNTQQNFLLSHGWSTVTALFSAVYDAGGNTITFSCSGGGLSVAHSASNTTVDYHVTTLINATS